MSSRIVEMKRELCQCGCGQGIWAATSDKSPFFASPSCQKAYTTIITNELSERAATGEAECIVPSTSSVLLLSSGSSVSDDSSETG